MKKVTWLIKLLRYGKNKKAKCIPHATRCRIPLFILIIIIFNLTSPKIAKSTETRIFYARIDIKYSDNRIKKSNFLMVPAENDFRAANFTYVLISGTANSAYNSRKLSLETAAEHNAIKYLLEQYGLKSVKSRSTDINNSGHTEMVISYEGAVKLPCKILKKKFDKKKGILTITIKIAFSPIAFPDKWSMLRLKRKIYQFFRNFILMFK